MKLRFGDAVQFIEQNFKVNFYDKKCANTGTFFI